MFSTIILGKGKYNYVCCLGGGGYNLDFMLHVSLLHDLAFEMSMQTCQMIVNLVKILVTTLYDK